MEIHSELKKKIWTIMPYIYFISLAAFWFLGDYFAKQNLSFLALGIMLILITQAVVQNKTIGVTLGILAIVVNMIFFFAVLSEFMEFKSITSRAIQLITVGSIE